MAKIALNIMKVGMHSYFPNADLNLLLNFNFEKLVKRETSLCGFAKVGLKGKLRRTVSTGLGLKGVKIA